MRSLLFGSRPKQRGTVKKTRPIKKNRNVDQMVLTTLTKTSGDVYIFLDRVRTSYFSR